jgi:hypothetical protein
MPPKKKIADDAHLSNKDIKEALAKQRKATKGIKESLETLEPRIAGVEASLQAILASSDQQNVLQQDSQQIFAQIHRDLEAIKKGFTRSLQKEVGALRAEFASRVQVCACFCASLTGLTDGCFRR